MNGFVSQLGDMPWSKVFVAGLVACVLYYFTLFNNGSTLKETIESKVAVRDQANVDLDQMRIELKKANDFEKQVKEMTAEFEKIVEFMPEDMSVATLNEIITRQVAQQPTIRSNRIEPDSRIERKDFYEMMRVRIQLEGTFAQLMQFLSGLSHADKLKRLLTLDEVELKALSSGEDAKLSFSASVVGYRYLRNVGDAAGQAAAPAGGQNAPQ